MSFGQVSKTEIIILTIFWVCCTKREAFGGGGVRGERVWEGGGGKAMYIHVYYCIYKFQQAMICGKAVFNEDLLYTYIKFN